MSNIQNITGQWLDSYKWSYFLTLTTRYELTLKAARRVSAAFYRKVNEKALMKGKTQTAWCYFIEAFENKRGYHIHALLHADISIKEIFDIWQCVTNAKENGSQYCRALEFIPEFGASFYVAKYISKKSFDWDFDYRGALAQQNANDLFDYKVTSPFSGWRKYDSKGRQELKAEEQKRTGALSPDLPSKQCRLKSATPQILELIQQRQTTNAKQVKRIKSQAKSVR